MNMPPALDTPVRAHRLRVIRYLAPRTLIAAAAAALV